MELNFGTRISEWDRTVKTYTLSPEELEKYREGKPVFTKEKYIQLKEEGKTDKEIMSLEQIDHNKLYTLKKRWELTGVKIEPKEENTIETKEEDEPLWRSMIKDRDEKIKELETALAEKTKAFEMVVGASEKAIEENELLKKEIEELTEQLMQPRPTHNGTFSEHLQEQNHVLRQCLKMVL